MEIILNIIEDYERKVVIIGGKGTAVVIAEQIYDAQIRFGKEIEVIGFAFDDPAFLGGINGWPVLWLDEGGL